MTVTAFSVHWSVGVVHTGAYIVSHAVEHIDRFQRNQKVEHIIILVLALGCAVLDYKHDQR